MAEQLTQKEKDTLQDQMRHEQVCNRKYSDYAERAFDPALRNMFAEFARDEQDHYDTLSRLTGGFGQQQQPVANTLRPIGQPQWNPVNPNRSVPQVQQAFRYPPRPQAPIQQPPAWQESSRRQQFPGQTPGGWQAPVQPQAFRSAPWVPAQQPFQGILQPVGTIPYRGQVPNQGQNQQAATGSDAGRNAGRQAKRQARQDSDSGTAGASSGFADPGLKGFYGPGRVAQGFRPPQDREETRVGSLRTGGWMSDTRFIYGGQEPGEIGRGLGPTQVHEDIPGETPKFDGAIGWAHRDARRQVDDSPESSGAEHDEARADRPSATREARSERQARSQEIASLDSVGRYEAWATSDEHPRNNTMSALDSVGRYEAWATRNEEADLDVGTAAIIGAQAANTAAGNIDNDRAMCTDMLMTEKFVSGAYDSAIFDMTNPQARRALQQIQHDEQGHGEKIEKYMQNHGMTQGQ